MIPYVPNAFFTRRERVAKLLGFPVELTGIYHITLAGGDFSFGITKMLIPNPDWEAKNYGSIGYSQSVVGEDASGRTVVRKYFDLAKAPWAQFYLGRLPGCCGSAHLHDMICSTPMTVPRRGGMGSICLEIAEEASYWAGYRLITGTVINSNAFHLVDKYGWTKHRNWINNRTKNTVYLCSKELTADNAGRRIGDGASESSNKSNIREVTTLAGGAGFRA